MRTVAVLLKSQVKRRLPLKELPTAKILFLCVDYELRQDLKDRFGIEFFEWQHWLFNNTASDIRNDYAEAMASMNEHADFFWWGSQIASKSTSANMFFKEIVFFFMALKYLQQKTGDLIIIVDSVALGGAIECRAQEFGIRVLRNFALSKIALGLSQLMLFVRSGLKIAFFALKMFNTMLYFRIQKISSVGLQCSRPMVLMRTWVTEGSYTAKGFEERVFEPLVDFLKKSGKIVVFCPMFFNLKRSLAKAYQGIAERGIFHIVPESLVGCRDILHMTGDCLRMIVLRASSWKIRGEELKPLLNEAIACSAMDGVLFALNIQGRALAALKKKGILIETVIYPFENNAPEKAFIMDTRHHYPEANLIGFAHTTFFREQAASYLGVKEHKFHPLPDRIVTKGGRLVELLKEANFPKDILREGPNLRFNYIHKFVPGGVLKENPTLTQDILVPLSHSYSLAFDVLDKLEEALVRFPNTKVFIRNHPLLDEARIKAYALRKKLTFSFADTGSFMDWLRRVGVVVTTGASITTLEAVICGVPVIRVTPDLDLHYDCYHDERYPITMVNTGKELADKITLAHDLRLHHQDVLIDAAKRAKQDYFNEPNDQLMSLFLKSFN